MGIRRTLCTVACLLIPCALMAMQQENTSKIPIIIEGNKPSVGLVLNKDRLEKYVTDFINNHHNSSARTNPNGYKEQLAQQCINGGRYVSSLILKENEKLISSETPIDHIKKIYSVLTFCFNKYPTTREQGPHWWTLKLRGTDQWEDFFIISLYKLGLNKKKEYIKKVNVKGIDQCASIGHLIEIKRDELSPFILPYEHDSILIIPSSDKKICDYLTVKTGNESETGWSLRDPNITLTQQLWSVYEKPMSLYKGFTSFLNKTSLFGNYLPNDGSKATEYLTEDAAQRIKKAFPNMEISPISPSISSFAVLLANALKEKDLGKERTQELEIAQSYLKKQFNNLKVRKGNEIIFNKQWLAANAYFYLLLEENTNDFLHTKASEKYYEVLKELRLLNTLIFFYNRFPEKNNFDIVLKQAKIIATDDFKTLIEKSVSNKEIQHYLLQMRTAITSALESNQQTQHLLEQHFFDQDDLNEIIKEIIGEEQFEKMYPKIKQ